MLAGAPHEAGWLRAEPSRTCARSLRERVVQTVFPRCYVANIQPLTEWFAQCEFQAPTRLHRRVNRATHLIGCNHETNEHPIRAPPPNIRCLYTLRKTTRTGGKIGI
jgi:hypothetical protein